MGMQREITKPGHWVKRWADHGQFFRSVLKTMYAQFLDNLKSAGQICLPQKTKHYSLVKLLDMLSKEAILLPKRDNNFIARKEFINSLVFWKPDCQCPTMEKAQSTTYHGFKKCQILTGHKKVKFLTSFNNKGGSSKRKPL